MPTLAEIWHTLETVPDPEIPVVSLVEMGVVRDVKRAPEGEVTVTITPTFSGCPALHTMRDQITARLLALGCPSVQVETTLSPAWTTDWITGPARAKLKAFGLAPPPRHGGDFAHLLFDPVPCPHCGSTSTTLRNAWGSTLCRMIYTCNTCQEPFEQFKPV